MPESVIPEGRSRASGTGYEAGDEAANEMIDRIQKLEGTRFERSFQQSTMDYERGFVFMTVSSRSRFCPRFRSAQDFLKRGLKHQADFYGSSQCDGCPDKLRVSD